MDKLHEEKLTKKTESLNESSFIINVYFSNQLFSNSTSSFSAILGKIDEIYLFIYLSSLKYWKGISGRTKFM